MYGTSRARDGLMLNESWRHHLTSKEKINLHETSPARAGLMLKESWRRHLASKEQINLYETNPARAGLMLKESWRHHLASKEQITTAILPVILDFVNRFVSNSYRLCLLLFRAIKNEISISNHFPGFHTHKHTLLIIF